MSHGVGVLSDVVRPAAGAPRRGVLARALAVARAGVVATVQVPSLGAGPDLGGADEAERRPRLALTARDDCGGRHTGHPHEGSGFGQGRDWPWRGASRCVPALDPAARTRTRSLATLTWLRPDEHLRRCVPLPTLDGPWAFAVHLAGA
ncbi:MAG TPA: hypothetical protein VFW96_07985 [Thermomicrobiales bacterium]|nr:hypothetical protein [Thermomicrobiales bacterium]